MTLIEIPDDQAAVLRAKAAEQGLTLEDWLGQLAGVTPRHKTKRPYRLADLLAECDPSAALSQEDGDWLSSPKSGREAL